MAIQLRCSCVGGAQLLIGSCFGVGRGRHLVTVIGVGMFTRVWRKWSRLTDVLSDTIPGMRVVKAFNQGPRENERFSERNADVVGKFNRVHASSALDVAQGKSLAGHPRRQPGRARHSRGREQARRAEKVASATTRLAVGQY